jgi:glucuronate isomerase
MTPFIHDDFFLDTKMAKRLYHEVACDLPIIDFHNHLNPIQLAENRSFDNIAQLWLVSDPYKHRAMRINGVPERIITGDTPDKEKFMHWARTVPYTVGNPLYHWTAMELKRVFDIDDLLCEETAESIWNRCNEKLKDDSFRACSLLKRWGAEVLCTSDDLLDSFKDHQTASGQFKVLPSLRGDSILAVTGAGFADWLKKLSELTGMKIQSLDNYLDAIRGRLDHMAGFGCVEADHALDNGFAFSTLSIRRAQGIFLKVIQGNRPDPDEILLLKSSILHLLGQEYGEREWWMLLHIGAQRSTSSRLRNLAGPAGGYAAIGNSCSVDDLCRFFDSLEQEGKLPRTALFNLNPSQNETLAALTGSFAQDGVAGKIQFGPAWWYNDHRDGMEKQLIALSNYGLLSRFIGMTTDSRSILSFSRHEYFRRILCRVLGSWVDSGEAPDDFSFLEQMVRNISYLNAKKALSKKGVNDDKKNAG